MIDRNMQKLGEERSAIRELFEYGNALKRTLGEDTVFDFSIGNPSAPTPECVRETAIALLREMPPELLHGYTSAPGCEEARAAVAEELSKMSQIRVPSRLIYMTCGASASLAIALMALVTAGEEVVVPAPYFPEYAVFVREAGGTLVPVPTDPRFHLDFDALDRAIGKNTAAVLVNSPNNPTGAVYSEEEMRRLGLLLEKKSGERGAPVYLLADEPYRELSFSGKVTPPFSVYSNTVVLYSYSKALSLAGERIGYLAVSPRMKEGEAVFSALAGAARRFGYVCAPALFQRIVARCTGMHADFSVYEENRALLLKHFRGMGYEFSEPQGAFYLFAKCPSPPSDFFERAKKKGVLVVPSESFGIEGYFRLSYCVPTERIQGSIPRFEALLKEANGKIE